MNIAFFDLDKTLLAENSAKIWLRSQWQTRQIELKQMIHASYLIFKYHLGFTNFETIITEGITLIAGESMDSVLTRARAFFGEAIQHLYRPGALKALAEHRSLGHSVVLLTSTFDALSQLVAKI
jgi:phosphoserine phosphatase